jgi:hypothetical protein
MRRLLVTLSALPILSLPPIYTILITTPTAASPAISLYPPWSPSSHSHSLSRRAASVRSFPPSFLNLGCTGFTPSAHTRQPDRLAHHPTSHFIPYTPLTSPSFRHCSFACADTVSHAQLSHPSALCTSKALVSSYSRCAQLRSTPVIRPANQFSLT